MLWGVLSDYEDWRLIISGRQLDLPDQRDAYGLIHDALAPAGFDARNTPILLPTSDRFVKDLRRVFGKAKKVEAMRLGSMLFGDRYLEDGYAYRIA